jgi:tripeptidyl-peptidase-2
VEDGKLTGILCLLIDLSDSVQIQSCNISPRIMRSARESSNADKLTHEVNLTLRANVDWIKTPEFLHLNYSGRSFDVRVDSTGLAPGLHFGRVEAFDSSCATIPLFTVPGLTLN